MEVKKSKTRSENLKKYFREHPEVLEQQIKRLKDYNSKYVLGKPRSKEHSLNISKAKKGKSIHNFEWGRDHALKVSLTMLSKKQAEELRQLQEKQAEEIRLNIKSHKNKWDMIKRYYALGLKEGGSNER